MKNILLILIDCLRSDFVEDDKAYTPTIQKLAKNGHFLPNTIASTSTTTPSVASLLTGLYPFENGVRSHSGYSLDNTVSPFPEILQKHGYHTYAEVSGPLVPEIELTRGFDEYHLRDREVTIHTRWGEKPLEKIENYYEEPWFVFFHIWSLHRPRIVLPECNTKKHGNTLYARSLASIDKYLTKLLKRVDENTLIVLTGDHGERISHHTRLETYVRRKILENIFKLLQERQIVKIPMGRGVRPFHIGHGYTIYDEVVKVPLIFHDANTPQGTSSTQIRQIDIFPTILDALNLEHGLEVRGESVLPIMEGTVTNHRNAYMEAVGRILPDKSEWSAGMRVKNKFKYIHYPFRPDYKEELYDLTEDPTETINLAPQNPKLAYRCNTMIDSMQTHEFVGEKIDEKAREEIKERLKALGYVD